MGVVEAQKESPRATVLKTHLLEPKLVPLLEPKLVPLLDQKSVLLDKNDKKVSKPTESKPAVSGKSSGQEVSPEPKVIFFSKLLWSEHADLPEDYLVDLCSNGSSAVFPMANQYAIPTPFCFGCSTCTSRSHDLCNNKKGKLILQITQDLIQRGILDGSSPAKIQFHDKKSLYLICDSNKTLVELSKFPPRIDGTPLQLLKKGHPRGQLELSLLKLVSIDSVAALSADLNKAKFSNGSKNGAGILDQDLSAIVGVYYRISDLCSKPVFSGDVYLLHKRWIQYHRSEADPGNWQFTPVSYASEEADNNNAAQTEITDTSKPGKTLSPVPLQSCTPS